MTGTSRRKWKKICFVQSQLKNPEKEKQQPKKTQQNDNIKSRY